MEMVASWEGNFRKMGAGRGPFLLFFFSRFFPLWFFYTYTYTDHSFEFERGMPILTPALQVKEWEYLI